MEGKNSIRFLVKAVPEMKGSLASSDYSFMLSVHVHPEDDIV
jgi:hypothetical protein